MQTKFLQADTRKSTAILKKYLREKYGINASIKSKDYTGYYQKVKPMTYQIFYIIGASVFVLGLIGAFIIYLVKGKKTY